MMKVNGMHVGVKREGFNEGRGQPDVEEGIPQVRPPLFRDDETPTQKLFKSFCYLLCCPFLSCWIVLKRLEKALDACLKMADRVLGRAVECMAAFFEAVFGAIRTVLGAVVGAIQAVLGAVYANILAPLYHRVFLPLGQFVLGALHPIPPHPTPCHPSTSHPTPPLPHPQPAPPLASVCEFVSISGSFAHNLLLTTCSLLLTTHHPLLTPYYLLLNT